MNYIWRFVRKQIRLEEIAISQFSFDNYSELPPLIFSHHSVRRDSTGFEKAALTI